jgi:hypothetical protein
VGIFLDLVIHFVHPLRESSDTFEDVGDFTRVLLEVFQAIVKFFQLAVDVATMYPLTKLVGLSLPLFNIGGSS